MTHINTVAAPASSGTSGDAEVEILCLDPDVAALFDEVDAILCAALAPRRCPPVPRVAAGARMRPRPAVRPWGVLVRPRAGPVHPVRAVERGPPTSEQPATTIDNPRKGR